MNHTQLPNNIINENMTYVVILIKNDLLYHPLQFRSLILGNPE